MGEGWGEGIRPHLGWSSTGGIAGAGFTSSGYCGFQLGKTLFQQRQLSRVRSRDLCLHVKLFAAH